jgi:hypothetical protein
VNRALSPRNERVDHAAALKFTIPNAPHNRGCGRTHCYRSLRLDRRLRLQHRRCQLDYCRTKFSGGKSESLNFHFDIHFSAKCGRGLRSHRAWTSRALSEDVVGRE